MRTPRAERLLFVVGPLLLAGAMAWLSGCAGNVQTPAAATRIWVMPAEVDEIDAAAVQLIPKLDADIPELAEVRNLVVWPIQPYLAAYADLQDRSTVLRPLPTPPTSRYLHPVSPREALRGAAAVVRSMLRPEWLPENLEGGLDGCLIPQKMTDPVKSRVVTRYTLNECEIQIVLRRWWRIIVLRPARPPEFKGPEEFGPWALARFFNNGELMARVPARPAAPTPSGLTVFLEEYDPQRLIAALGVEAYRKYNDQGWGWVSWYTDGRAVAIFLRYWSSPDEQHVPMDTDPWF